MTLTQRRVATVRAALRYWLEEIGPHLPDGALPYLDPPDESPLDATEIADLQELVGHGVRYALYDPNRNRLRSTELYEREEQVPADAEKEMVAMVILPRLPRPDASTDPS